MSFPVLQRWLLASACLAILLVVVAPLVSRALAYPTVASAATPADSASTQHMHHGMDHGVDHAMPMTPSAVDPSVSDAASSTSSDPHAEHEMGVDCEYCLIAARMISLLVALLLLITAWQAVFRAVAGPADAQRIPARGTLGARGPPLLLAF